MLTTFASPFHGAMHCAKLGFKVFPCADKTKKAMVPWRKESTDNLEKLKDWDRKWPGANYAIDCGKSGLCVIDLDVKNGKDGITSWKAYCEENFLGDDVLTTVTPSGGEHKFFKGSAKTTTEWLSGVDVRSEGGYVVAPGSVLATGGAYLLKSREVLELPQFVGESIGRANVRATSSTMEAPAGGWDKPANVAWAIMFLSTTAKPAVEGESGDRQTFLTACILKDHGVSPAKAQELMVEYFNPRCIPPWDPSDMSVKIDSAYRPGRMNEPGAADPASAFADAPALEVEAEVIEETTWLNWSNAQFMPRKARPWYVSGWFPRGAATPTLFAGPGGAGKTLAAMQAALSIRTGVPLWGVTPSCTAGACLLVLCEDDNDEIINRLNDIREMAAPEFLDKVEACDVKLMSMVGQDCMMVHAKDGKVKRGKFFDKLDKKLSALGGQEVDKWVAIDTAADVFAGDECDRSAVNAFVKYHLIELGIKHNATIVLLAHPAKAEGSTYSGSTAWNNSFRHRLFMDYYDPKKPDDFRRISVAKSNYQRSGDSLVLRYDRGVFVRANDDEVKCGYAAAVYSAIDAAVECGEPLARAKQSPRCIYDQQIVDNTGRRLSVEAVRAGLDELLMSGQVEERKGKKHGNGLFPARVIGLEDEGDEA